MLVGIEAEDILTFGDDCTPAVQAAIPWRSGMSWPPLRPAQQPEEKNHDLSRSPASVSLFRHGQRRHPQGRRHDGRGEDRPRGNRDVSGSAPATSLYIITKGEVDIQYVLGNGEHRTVDTLVDGDLLCWSALVEPYKTTANGIARKETHLVAISGDRLRALCVADPALGYRLLTQIARLLAHRLEGARVQLATAD